MAQVHPFRAYRYNPARASYNRVLTQPYDKITPAMQEQYYAADPNNLITIEKGKSYESDTPQNNVYTRAAQSVHDWIANGVIVADQAPAFYAYTQEYSVPGTQERRTRRGFIGTGKLEDYSACVVFRHEHTLSGPKADRLELLRSTKLHTGQLFMLYSDAQKRVDKILSEAQTQSPPVTELCDEYGVLHRLWVVAEPERVAAIHTAMKDQKLVIADGHHRYETALTYRNERRTQAGKLDPNAPFERVMMTFVNTQSEGLLILPGHRLASSLHDFRWPDVRRYLEPWFSAETFSFANEQERATARTKFLARLTEQRAHRAIGAYPASDNGQHTYYLLTLRPGADLSHLLPNVSLLQRELDVVLLHEGILEPALGITPQAVTAEANLSYERDAATALDVVDRGGAEVAFLLNACGVDQVMKIATAGEVMPQKSTDFYPKMLSGLTMYRLE